MPLDHRKIVGEVGVKSALQLAIGDSSPACESSLSREVSLMSAVDANFVRSG